MSARRRWLLTPFLLVLVITAESFAFLLTLYAWLKDYRQWEGGFFAFYRTLRKDALR